MKLPNWKAMGVAIALALTPGHKEKPAQIEALQSGQVGDIQREISVEVLSVLKPRLFSKFEMGKHGFQKNKHSNNPVNYERPFPESLTVDEKDHFLEASESYNEATSARAAYNKSHNRVDAKKAIEFYTKAYELHPSTNLYTLVHVAELKKDMGEPYEEWIVKLAQHPDFTFEKFREFLQEILEISHESEAKAYLDHLQQTFAQPHSELETLEQLESNIAQIIVKKEEARKGLKTLYDIRPSTAFYIGNGYWITAKHSVPENPQSLYLRFPGSDQTPFGAEGIYRHPTSDLAIVKTGYRPIHAYLNVGSDTKIDDEATYFSYGFPAETGRRASFTGAPIAKFQGNSYYLGYGEKGCSGSPVFDESGSVKAMVWGGAPLNFGADQVHGGALIRMSEVQDFIKGVRSGAIQPSP